MILFKDIKLYWSRWKSAGWNRLTDGIHDNSCLQFSPSSYGCVLARNRKLSDPLRSKSRKSHPTSAGFVITSCRNNFYIQIILLFVSVPHNVVLAVHQIIDMWFVHWCSSILLTGGINTMLWGVLNISALKAICVLSLSFWVWTCKSFMHVNKFIWVVHHPDCWMWFCGSLGSHILASYM
jgi:hypothetical protein